MALKMRKNQSPAVPHNCPLTECMSIIGGAWTVNIIWALRGGPRRFSELRQDIPAVSPKVLTTRLKELTERKLVSRVVRDTSPPSVEYALTSFGEELMPAIDGILAVGHKLKLENDKLTANA
jgi:DNA-binding HxlR family transcriptional regulator